MQRLDAASALFIPFADAAARFEGKRVALVGSAPACTDNVEGWVDSHDVVVRVNNFKLGRTQGQRCDVHYSFYGTSIRKTAVELLAAGVTLCMCKCPNGKPLRSEWHERTGRQVGIDYRYIYENRRDWWFCPTFVPEPARFLWKFDLLGQHIPTTGFAALLDILEAKPRSLYLTGFDFFTSGIHNVNEPWGGREKNLDDPIRHRPDFEEAWLWENVDRFPIELDHALADRLSYARAA